MIKTTTPFGLPEPTIKQIQAVFAKHPVVKKVVLYGSRATGKHRTGSDIDLTMYGEHTDSISYNVLSRIDGQLDDLPIPYTIDISIFDSLDHAKLRDQIERHGQLFFEREVVSWKTMKLGEVCEFTRGLTYSKKDEMEFSNNAVLRATNIDLETHRLNLDDIRFISDEITVKQKNKVMQNDILICTASGSKRHLGKVAFIDSSIDFAFGGFMGILRANEKILPPYLFKNLISQNFKNHLAKLSDGSSINNLRFDLIKDYQIHLPPLPIQKQIVEKLDVAFANIDKAINATLKNIENAEALFQKKLNNFINKDRKDWREFELSEIGDIKTGSTPKTSEKENFGSYIPFIKPADFNPDGSINFSNKGLSEIGAMKSRIVKSSSVLMVCIGATIGKTGFTDTQICTNQQINSVTPKKGIDAKFLYFQMLTTEFQRSVVSNAGQVTLPIINKTKWQSLKMSLPEYAEQINLRTNLEKLLKLSLNLKTTGNQKISQLKSLKSSILNQAFSGEPTQDVA